MTVLASLASQSFAPQTRTIPFTVAVDAMQLVVTFTRGDWPEGGPVLRCTLLWGGVPAGNFTTSGGVPQDLPRAWLRRLCCKRSPRRFWWSPFK